jgi:hypothetical protein
MSLKHIVDTIQAKKDLIAMEKDIINIEDPTAQRMKLGHIKRAKEDLKQLFMDYRRELQSRAAFIVVTGGKSDKFAKTAEDDFGCFSVDAEEFYRQIADQVPEVVYKGKTANQSLFEHLMARFEDRALNIDIIGYTPMLFESKYRKVLKDKDAMIELFKIAFNDKVGSEVVGLDAIDKVSEKAVNEGFAGKTVPIVLYTKDKALVSDLLANLGKLTNNVFLVTTGEDLDEKLLQKSTASVKTATKKQVEESLLKVRSLL